MLQNTLSLSVSNWRDSFLSQNTDSGWHMILNKSWQYNSHYTEKCDRPGNFCYGSVQCPCPGSAKYCLLPVCSVANGLVQDLLLRTPHRSKLLILPWPLTLKDKLYWQNMWVTTLLYAHNIGVFPLSNWYSLYLRKQHTSSVKVLVISSHLSSYLPMFDVNILVLVLSLFSSFHHYTSISLAALVYTLALPVKV